MLFLFRGLDLFLIDKVFDPLALKIHKLWGISCYTLAKWLLTLGTAILLGSFYQLIVAPSKQLIMLSVLAIAVEFSFAFSAFREADRLERMYDSPTVDKLPPNLRDGMGVHVSNRRFFIFLGVLIFASEALTSISKPLHIIVDHKLYDNLRIIAVYVVLTGFFFLACTPRLRRPKTEEKKTEKTVLTPAPQGA